MGPGNTYLLPHLEDFDGENDSDDVATNTYTPSSPDRHDEVLEFQYSDLKEPLCPPANMYDGGGPALRPSVAASFKTAFECVRHCGGMNLEFFKWRPVHL